MPSDDAPLIVFDTFTGTGRLRLDRVAVPTLVLGGPDDPALSCGRAAGLARDFPAARVVLREHYGHFCHVEQVADVAAEITPFLCPDPVGGPLR